MSDDLGSQATDNITGTTDDACRSHSAIFSSSTGRLRRNLSSTYHENRLSPSSCSTNITTGATLLSLPQCSVFLCEVHTVSPIIEMRRLRKEFLLKHVFFCVKDFLFFRRSARASTMSKKWFGPVIIVLTKQERNKKEEYNNIIMPRFNSALAIFGLAATSTWNVTHASGSLRKPGWQPSLIDVVVARLDELENEIKIIPTLQEKITKLETQISELQKHRMMLDECGLVLSEGGACQLNAPLEVLSDLIVNGTSTLYGDLNVEQGDTVLGGNVTIFSNEVSIIGSTKLNDLIVESSLEVWGESTFESDIEATKNVKLDKGVRMGGMAHFHDLEIDHELDVHGETHIDEKVFIEGRRGQLIVDGDVHFHGEKSEFVIEGEAIFEGDEIFEGDVEFEGEIEVDKKAIFKRDVEMKKKLTVDELKVESSPCDGCA
jgi:hypothetical protein